MLAKIRDIVVDFWQSLSGREKIGFLVGNVVFLAAFFIGVPKAGFMTYVILFLVLEAIYLGLVYIVKTHILGD